MKYEISPLVTLSIFSALLFFVSIGPVTVAVSAVTVLVWIEFFMTISAMKKFEVLTGIHPSRVFEEEEVESSVSVVNRSKFGFSHVEIDDFGVDGYMISGERNSEGLLETNGRVDLKYSVGFRKRGEHIFRDVRIRVRSPWDLFNIDKIYKLDRKILVFPKLLPLDYFRTLLIDPSEGVQTDFKILEDPVHLYGVREYGSEPFQRIHWKVSAHTGELMVKEYEFTASSTVKIYIDYNLPKEIFARTVWSKMREDYEENVSMAASGLIKYLHEKGMQINLKVIADGISEITPQTAGRDYIPYLEVLARARGVDEPEFSMEQVISNDVHGVYRNTTVVLFSLYLTDEIIPKLLTVRSRVARVIVFVIPYGFRLPSQKKYETYSVLPRDVNELREKSSLLMKNGVMVHVVMDNESIDEVIKGYEKNRLDNR